MARMLLPALLSWVSSLAFGQSAQSNTNPLIDYKGFNQLTQEVQEFRNQRKVQLKDFAEMAKDENTIVLDTRSRSAYEKKHFKGAVHLNFSDFTKEKLAKVIPSKDTRVLIYCNNNFMDDPVNFAAKAPALALNIPTFINLYGYGYKNLYELHGIYVTKNQNAAYFEGTDVE